MKKSITLAMLSSLAFAGAASAQTTTTPDPSPATVGVSKPKAVNAETKAVPRSDTGTLVRTDKTTGAMNNNGTTAVPMTDADANHGAMAADDAASMPSHHGHHAHHARN